jgi:hypothetical protein
MKRTELIGPNFASLGKLFVGEYAKTGEMISSPQQRGNYLGRATGCTPTKLQKTFGSFCLIKMREVPTSIRSSTTASGRL